MAVATSTTLWWTLRQTQQLAQPYQQSDLWYVSSIHSELARVSLLAHNVADHGAPTSELHERLEVLLSTLDTSAQAPRISNQLRTALPHAAHNLDELLHQAEAWSRRLGAADADGAAVAADIVSASDAQLDTVRKAVAAVHLLNTQQTDRARQQLHDRFKVLSTVLGGLDRKSTRLNSSH